MRAYSEGVGKRAAIFLDRDDTIIDNRDATAHTAHPGDLLDPALVRLLPRAGEAMKLLAGTGLPLVVITNQGGIAQGIATHADVEAVNDRLREILMGLGVRLAAMYYSPNRELKGGPANVYNTPHAWRKPNPGMLLAAAEELEIDLARSWMVGDAQRDVEAGIRAGLDPKRCLLIAGEFDLYAAAERITTSCEPRLP